jgi:hypothetical protein
MVEHRFAASSETQRPVSSDWETNAKHPPGGFSRRVFCFIASVHFVTSDIIDDTRNDIPRINIVCTP